MRAADERDAIDAALDEALHLLHLAPLVVLRICYQ